jgi:hypothetical protein
MMSEQGQKQGGGKENSVWKKKGTERQGKPQLSVKTGHVFYMVGYGEYRDKERPFAINNQPTALSYGRLNRCIAAYVLKSTFEPLGVEVIEVAFGNTGIRHNTARMHICMKTTTDMCIPNAVSVRFGGFAIVNFKLHQESIRNALGFPGVLIMQYLNSSVTDITPEIIAQTFQACAQKLGFTDINIDTEVTDGVTSLKTNVTMRKVSKSMTIFALDMEKAEATGEFFKLNNELIGNTHSNLHVFFKREEILNSALESSSVVSVSSIPADIGTIMVSNRFPDTEAAGPLDGPTHTRGNNNRGGHDSRLKQSGQRSNTQGGGNGKNAAAQEGVGGGGCVISTKTQERVDGGERGKGRGRGRGEGRGEGRDGGRGEERDGGRGRGRGGGRTSPPSSGDDVKDKKAET